MRNTSCEQDDGPLVRCEWFVVPKPPQALRVEVVVGRPAGKLTSSGVALHRKDQHLRISMSSILAKHLTWVDFDHPFGANKKKECHLTTNHPLHTSPL